MPLLSKITLSYKVVFSGIIPFILEIKFLDWNEASQILPNLPKILKICGLNTVYETQNDKADDRNPKSCISALCWAIFPQI